MKILFLLKENGGYGENYAKTGLKNSCQRTVDELNLIFSGVYSYISCAIDGNDIDRILTRDRPDICIVQALWVVPSKIAELKVIHPNVRFIIMIHSKIPFLATEGIAIEWIRNYPCEISFNNYETYKDFRSVGIESIYLPNLYSRQCEDDDSISIKHYVKYYLNLKKHYPHYINISSFGAIRPFKNQLIQAMAAINFSEKNRIKLNFHINAPRVEQNGDNVLRNIRSLFKNSKHTLVEHPWHEPSEFLKVVSSMDIGMQVSITESFNIITADFVSKGIPIIVSNDISWMSNITKCSPHSMSEIVNKLDQAHHNGKLFVTLSKQALNRYIASSVSAWRDFL